MVRDGETESRSLDFKEAFPGSAQSDRLEFLKDVAAMANAAGGRILFGIAEKRDDSGRPTGAAGAAPGVIEPNVGQATLRLEQIIRSGIEPRIQGCRFYEVTLPDGPRIVVLDIPRSWLAPHMVCLEGKQLFYARRGTGNHPLDVGEIRSAFLASEAMGTKMRRFRDERLGRIWAEETPIALPPGVRFVLHLLPFEAFAGVARMDIRTMAEQSRMVAPDFSYRRFNIDGVLRFPWVGPNGPEGYVQLFQTGIIESVLAVDDLPYRGRRGIAIGMVEERLRKLFVAQVKGLATMGISPPVVVEGAILNAKGIVLPLRTDDFPDEVEHRAIDRDVVNLPDILLENLTEDPEVALQSIFEAIYQASGCLRP